MYDLFISYARKELSTVQPFVEQLRSQGFRVFHDVSGIDGGTSFPDVISDAIDSSALVVAFWSRMYFTRSWCLIEAREGLSANKLIPIRIEKFERNAPPADLRYINFYSVLSDDGFQHSDWERVLNAINDHLSRSDGSSSATRANDEANSSNNAESIITDRDATLAPHKLEDLRQTWTNFPDKNNPLAVAQFATFISEQAPGTGLEFEVKLHLDALTVGASADRQHREKNAPIQGRAEPVFSEAIATARAAAISKGAISKRFYGLELDGVDDWPNPQLIVLPPGAFEMGRLQTGKPDDPTFARETPRHTVHLDYPLAVGVHPVTVREYKAFVATSGYKVERGAYGVNAKRYPNRSWPYNQKLSWKNPGFVQSPSSPVVCVNSFDIKAYLDWLNLRLGLTDPETAYRLPSEAEWEYACRAGTSTAYSFGDEADLEYAHYFDPDAALQSQRPKQKSGTREVGKHPPNPFGLMDMHGNVWEMCEDWWNESYHGAPVDGRAWISGDPSRRVTRGGSWASLPDRVTSSFRGRVDTASRFDFLSFRIARKLL